MSHCYPLNGNLQNPRVPATAGILAAYRGLLSNCALSGPTNFAPVISTTLDAVRAYPRGSKYMCLLILTDGAITDMEATVSCAPPSPPTVLLPDQMLSETLLLVT